MLNIDFTNSDNIIFLIIISVIVFVFIFLFLFILSGIVKIGRKVFKSTLNKNAKKPEFVSTEPAQKENADLVLVKEGLKETSRAVGPPVQRAPRLAEEPMLNHLPTHPVEPPHIHEAPAVGSAGFDFFGGSAGGETGKIPAPIKINRAAKPEEADMFEGQKEISRLKLEHELRLDPKIWKAQRQAGLNLSRAERAELVKEVFSKSLGRNISKSDLKVSVRKLGQKMISTQDPTQHAKLRKELKFFKKIGGIK